MNKTAIKNFAIWARNKLIADIIYRAGLMGITADGIQNALPQSTGTTEFYDIGTAEPYTIAGEAVKQRRHLVDLICTKEKETNYKTAYKYVLEEVAYTWFNRLIAVRFMEVNDYLPSHIRVLSSDSGKMEPDLVTTPLEAELSFTRDEEQMVYRLKQENKIDELFRILFIKQCNALNEILPALFEKTSDYTELLLNLSVIDQDGVIYHLVHDIPEEDFDVERGGQVEIIGWLYQYYNTEPKEQVFSDLKKNIKISKGKIPAATQLFTPDWIVRYMVENSLGRLWVEGHPNNELKAGWKYYLEDAEQEPEVEAKLAEIRTEYAKLNPENIKVIDPCMGSGHILVYAFDVLMQIYESAGYGQRDAAISILENNLYGLDIDERAFQMAYFAVMMKARQYNRRIMNGEYKPNVYSIRESNGINREHLKYFGVSLNDFEKNNAITQMTDLLDTFMDAKEYGSILTVYQYDWALLERFVSDIEKIRQVSLFTVGLDETAEELKRMIDQGKVLVQKYHVTITNPPYMGASNMGAKLNSFVKKNYPDSKNDMSTVCMEKCMSMCLEIGYMAMINIPVWMFLSGYEKLRLKQLYGNTYVNMVHPGRGVFGSDFGTTSFVLLKKHIAGHIGVYRRLFDKQGEVESNEIREEKFLSGKGKFLFQQDKYCKIPGVPLAYWVSPNFSEIFEKQYIIADISFPKQGIHTGDNNLYLRCWQEVEYGAINLSDEESWGENKYRWAKLNKGGNYRKWYGNREYILLWEYDGKAIKTNGRSVGANNKSFFKNQIGFTDVTSYKPSFRYYGKGFVFDVAGPAIPNDGSLFSDVFLLALLNSRVTEEAMSVLSPTIHMNQTALSKVSTDKLDPEITGYIEKLATQCIDISKRDWDSFEASWDFEWHPLLKNGHSRNNWNSNNTTIEECFLAWFAECNNRFEQIKANEEELNRIFIDIYGLQDELTPEVEDKDVTVRRADIQRDIKSLLSYAVGCMFGRYSLSSSGLAYAGGAWDESKYGQFKPDDDNIIPISDEEYLEDDIVSRFCTFLKVAFGESTLEENLDYIARALGNRGDSSREVIRNYFLNDFFKDHCQTYSVTGSGKRPIYWLFDSGKQNGFKALIYLHRYNADTIGNMRIDYLHRMQRIYESEISRMQDMIDHSTSAREVTQATKRREKLQKQLKECREYDEKLAHLALSRIELDLDDGVKKNYRKVQTANDGKFYEVLADSKNIMSKA